MYKKREKEVEKIPGNRRKTRKDRSRGNIYIYLYIRCACLCECARVCLCIYPFACQCACKYTPFHLLYVHSIIELPINSLNCAGKSLWPPLWF